MQRTLQVVALRVDATKAGQVVKKLRGHLLNIPKLRNVVPDPAGGGMKLVLLNTREASKETLQHTLAGFLRTGSFSFVPHTVQIHCSEEAKDMETVNCVVKTLPIGDVSFRPIDKNNVQQLREMNEKLFPIEYDNAFYQYVTDAHEEYCKIAYTDNNTAVGTVCCEVEDVKIAGKCRYRLYILSLGVMKECRRFKLGNLLLESVLRQARNDRLAYVYLHVHCSNTAAQRFYAAHGFEVVKLLPDYYTQLSPPHCFVLRKQLYHFQ